MHIKDHSAAMKFFRTYDNVASKGKWKEFVDEMEFDSMVQEPRITAQEPRMGLKPGGLVEPGVVNYGRAGDYESPARVAHNLSQKIKKYAAIKKVYDKAIKTGNWIFLKVM